MVDHHTRVSGARHPQTILGSCCVPWDKNGQLLEEVFRSTVATMYGHGFHDLYVFGTAGEGYAVDDRQFDAVTMAFVDEARAVGASSMIGVISQSLSTAIGRIERSAALGVTSFQISLPSWGRLNDRELAEFFREVCGRFPTFRFLHYNLPRVGRVLTASDYERLADTYPNLVATKNAGATNVQIVELLERAPELRHFFTEPGFAFGSLVGECGLIVSVSLLKPSLARAFYEAGVQRDAATVASLARELALIDARLEEAAGDAHMDGAYDKCVLKTLIPAFPLRLLPPYQGMTDEGFKQFVDYVEQEFPKWRP